MKGDKKEPKVAGVITAQKCGLVPSTSEGVNFLHRSFGVRRFCYNKTLEMYFFLLDAKSAGLDIGFFEDEHYTKELKALSERDDYEVKPYQPNISENVVRKLFNQIKEDFYPFVTQVSKCVAQEASIQAGITLQRYFAKECGRPKFKSKKDGQSFKISNDHIKFVKNEINGKDVWLLKLPCSNALFRPTEEPKHITSPDKYRLLSATVRYEHYKYFVSFSYEIITPLKEIYPQVDNQDSVGIDLGIKDLMVLSNGIVVSSLNPLRNAIKRLKRLQRRLGRKRHLNEDKVSNRYNKLKEQINKLHYYIANQRKDLLNKVTTSLVQNYKYVSIEDLAVANMMKNHCLARAIADCSWSMFRRMLEYKARLYGSKIIVIDRYTASSKTCFTCKKVNKDLTLNDREWSCTCGAIHHRDYNAAKNIESVGIETLVKITGLGESFSPVYRQTPGYVEGLSLKLRNSMGSLKSLVTVLPLIQPSLSTTCSRVDLSS